jgi:phosphonate transport system substrate-binding protein
VQAGKVDAGVLNSSVWDKLVASGKVDTDKVKVFATTPTYFDYNWTVRGSLDPALKDKIKAAFLALDPAKPEQKAILDLQAASRFIETRPENYDGIEQAARAAELLK